ncbi:DUF6036 family nucleotidyltransferase [Xanthomonas hortorum]|uniref:DUF6036 family nucleotidyltransferase n=1 Tax=Xanthomonas hortorum TaxID=56454 RepID=UPI001F2F2356|nr:DUF6036 family nucleotidyltransferase [Xanthomonas hortorum]MCE4551928.1 hypothetical protein [Xanthomonas hortorum pv. vitians]
MKPHQLDHILRSIDDATGHEHRFLLIGSQAILVHLDPTYFESEVLFVSREIDVALLDRPGEAAEEVADLIDKNFGDSSRFDQTFGYYADGVEVSTAILAAGWQDRLKPYLSDGVSPGTFMALSYEDLLVSKLCAGREKDLEFVTGMCAIRHPGLANVQSLLLSLPNSVNKERATAWWALHGA